MKRIGIAVALLAVVLGGCGANQANVNTSTHSYSFPKNFQGVPIHRIACYSHGMTLGKPLLVNHWVSLVRAEASTGS